jgi:hypothetical protein
MDYRQRSLIAAAITSNLGRVQDRLRDGDSYAIVEMTEFLQEIDDDDLGMDVIRGLVSSLPPVQAGAVLGTHPAWTALTEA